MVKNTAPDMPDMPDHLPEAKPPIEIDCPTCGKTVLWTDEFPDRPFCSARCKQIDFGDWANETNNIPGQSLMEAMADGDIDPEELARESGNLDQHSETKH